MNNKNIISEQVHKAGKSPIGGSLFSVGENSADLSEPFNPEFEVNSTIFLKEKVFRVLWRNIFKTKTLMLT